MSKLLKQKLEEETKKQSLRTILERLNQIDDDLAPEEFDPAFVVGDLRDKVDAIKWRLDTWRADARKIQEEWIDILTKKKDSLLRKAEKLEGYVLSQMQEKGFEKLPGHMMEVLIKQNPPAVQIDIEAGPEAFLQYDGLVLQKTVYQWDKKRVKALLDSGEELKFARITRGSRIDFKAKKGLTDVKPSEGNPSASTNV